MASVVPALAAAGLLTGGCRNPASDGSPSLQFPDGPGLWSAN